MPELYEIRVKGNLSKKFDKYFNGMDVVRLPNGTTTIVGEIVDQSALHSLLFKISSMNLTLISLNAITREAVEKFELGKRANKCAPDIE